MSQIDRLFRLFHSKVNHDQSTLAQGNNELRRNRTRAVLVVLSIAVGTFTVGVIINSQLVLSSSLSETYEATTPAHATYTCPEKFRTTSQRAEMGQNFSGELYLTLTPFNETLADGVRNVDGVTESE